MSTETKPEIVTEKIPFSNEWERSTHKTTEWARGWEAHYEWLGYDGRRDLFLITKTKVRT